MSERCKPDNPSRRDFLLGPVRRLRCEPEPIQGAKPRPTTSVSLLRQGNQALEEGDFDTAAQQFDQHVKANPEDVPVRCRLGYCLYRKGRYLHAKIEFERVLRASREHGFAALGLGLVLFRMNKPDKARAVLKRLCGCEPAQLQPVMAELSGQEAPAEQTVAQAEAMLSDHLPAG